MYETDLETFEKYVKEGIDSIGKKFRDKFDNLQFFVEEYPNNEQIDKLHLMQGHLLFGLYEGIPLEKRNSGYSGALPDKITIFKKPIEIFARDEEHLAQIVKNTIWHEIGHFLGMDEKQVREAERKRGHKY